jgi:hypothetical protein
MSSDQWAYKQGQEAARNGQSPPNLSNAPAVIRQKFEAGYADKKQR